MVVTYLNVAPIHVSRGKKKLKPRRMQSSARRHGVFLAWKLIGTLLRSFGRVLIEGVKYYADQPRMLGKTFLRLVSSFAHRFSFRYILYLNRTLVVTGKRLRQTRGLLQRRTGGPGVPPDERCGTRILWG